MARNNVKPAGKTNSMRVSPHPERSQAATVLAPVLSPGVEKCWEAKGARQLDSTKHVMALFAAPLAAAASSYDVLYCTRLLGPGATAPFSGIVKANVSKEGSSDG